MNSKLFQGTNVFMSRNLVPPEIFDTLHDALKQNGADVLLCCDSSRSGVRDYHVISSSDHEKFEVLRAQGCKLVGPKCVVSCAKERKPLPDQGYTCCLAMDGVKVLASGFEMDEKAEIEKLVTSMGGIFQTKTSPDVCFVIVKNVLAAKYKWALNVLKKPVVSINWLYQCRDEHRIVPQDSYRVLPFCGLRICVTGIPAEERKEVQKHVMQNAGKYSAELTKMCTHLIAEAPEGDKYKVARKWGHIQIVSRKWLEQSIARRACLDEESYPVQGASLSSKRTASGCLVRQPSQDKAVRNSQTTTAPRVGDSYCSSVAMAESADPDLEATLSQSFLVFSNARELAEGDINKMPDVPSHNEIDHGGCVAEDSQTEDNDLYLSDCRLSFVGFEASELRKLVNMLRKGGASRYAALNERLTHIIVGCPSELEKREVRGIAALGTLSVVRSSWLEDCEREKREVPVLPKHIAYDLLLPKGSQVSNRAPAVGISGVNQSINTTSKSTIPSDQPLENVNSRTTISLEKSESRPNIDNGGANNADERVRLSVQNLDYATKDASKIQRKLRIDCDSQSKKSSNVFNAKKFSFSIAFPEDRRVEIIEWINQGGGEVVDDPGMQSVSFIVECHGVKHKPGITKSTFVSSHWVRSCLEDGCLLDVGSHILYSPLTCWVPLPGFESFRFCVSQYEEKDRLLLRNLCFTLGAKFREKLTRKVTHLLCKFNTGPKYEAACKWGVQPVTSEWIYECVRQNKVVALDPFCPKEVSAQEAGLCNLTQFPSQAIQTLSGENPSQLPSQSQNLTTTINQNSSGGKRILSEDIKNSSFTKKTRLSEENGGPFSSGGIPIEPIASDNSSGGKLKDPQEVAEIVPDVAAAIEDLLEQTSKIRDKESPERTACTRNLLPPHCSTSIQERPESHMVVGLSKHWMNRTQKYDDIKCTTRDEKAGVFDGFSETQTESQVVGYEEDLSGRQMIIDRVRTQSSLG